MGYNFGTYHWRRRFRRLAVSGVVTALALILYRRAVSGMLRIPVVGIALWGLWNVVRTTRAILSPGPWRIERWKYESLASELPLATANSVLDIGCGTGRSLVGLAPHVRPTCTTVGLDRFDNRIILGNAPSLARRNARKTGLDAAVVRGDATRLPVSDGEVDVVTACRVLHDLSAPAARQALAEAHRSCRPDGTLGVLELPITHVETTTVSAYWRDLVADAGFEVTHAEEFERDGRRYVVIVADA